MRTRDRDRDLDRDRDRDRDRDELHPIVFKGQSYTTKFKKGAQEPIQKKVTADNHYENRSTRHASSCIPFGICMYVVGKSRTCVW
jgi:hypothetical protein